MSSAPLKSRKPRATRARRLGRASATVVAALTLVAASAAPAAAATAIDLGTAGSFAVLAGSGITNTGVTTIAGDVGSFPEPAITGFDGNVVLLGVNHGGNEVTQQAKQDLTAAYDQAFAAGPPTEVATELGGGSVPLTPGVYHGTTLEINGALTLNTLGDPNAVFVFQTDSTLKTGSASSVVVLGGGKACNVFWQVGSSAVLGSDSLLIGSVLAHTSISAGDRAVIQGRLLARGGAVTLQHNTIDARVCAAGADAGGDTTTPTTLPAAGATTPAAGDPAPGDATAAPASDTSTETARPAAPAAPPGGSITTVTRLPRTGPSDWLPLAGALAIALGLVLVRIGTPRVPLRHAIAPRHFVDRRSRS